MHSRSRQPHMASFDVCQTGDACKGLLQVPYFFPRGVPLLNNARILRLLLRTAIEKVHVFLFGLPFTLRCIRGDAVRTIAGERVLTTRSLTCLTNKRGPKTVKCYRAGAFHFLAYLHSNFPRLTSRRESAQRTATMRAVHPLAKNPFGEAVRIGSDY